MTHRWGTLAAVLTCLAAPSGNTALAAEPACFPERTLLGTTTPLYDERGREIGAMRGQTVNVVDDHVGPGGRWAEIQVDRPIAFRARVRRDELFVFLRRDLAIVPGESWWTIDAHMRIVDHEGTSVTVEPEARSQDVGNTTLTTSCDNLDGQAGKRLTCDRHGCRVHFSDRSLRYPGKAVALPDDLSIKVQIGPGVETSLSPFTTRSIRRRGSQTLVEMTDPWDQLRVRRWLPTKTLRAPTGGGVGMIPLGVEFPTSLGLRGDVIAQPTPLSAAPDGAPFVTLPPGVAYRVLEVREGQARVIARWPSWENDRFIDVRGWTSATSLPFLPDPRRRQDAVRGRVAFAPGIDRKVVSDLVVFADEDESKPGRPEHSTTVAPDGTFYLEVGEPFGGLRKIRVVVRNAAGDLSGVVDDAPVLAGGAEEVTVTVGRSGEHK
jgi:hypothetical protein